MRTAFPLRLHPGPFPLPLALALALLLGGCPDRRPGPGPDPARASLRLVPVPWPAAFDRERFSFVFLGDTRTSRSRCDARPGQPPVVTPQDRIIEQMLGAAAGFLSTRAEAPPERRNAFMLYTGDLVTRGSCARDWAWIERIFLSRIPRERLLPAIGNHETWHGKDEPEPLQLYFRAFAHLTDPVSREGWHHYAAEVGPVAVITLCTGAYPRFGTEEDFVRSDPTWACARASYAEQMRWMERGLDRAVARGTRHVVVNYHKPSFATVRHPPLHAANDPLEPLKRFKRRHPAINVLVTSGHNHTTQVFVADGVLLVLTAGAGAPQNLTTVKHAKPHPPERFWAGEPKVERYNLFRALIDGPRLSIEEWCLAGPRASPRLELGSRITAAGEVTRVPGACRLE
jgi:hypothetical protein